MTTVTGQADGSRRTHAVRAGVAPADVGQPRRLSLRDAGDHGDARRHRLPDLLHGRSFLLQNAARPAAEGQELRRHRQLHRHPHQRRVLARHPQHGDLDAVLHPDRLRAGLCPGAGAAPRLLRARRAARHLHHPLGHQRGRRVLYLEMDLSFGFRHHRRDARAARASPTGRRTSSTASAPSCRR